MLQQIIHHLSESLIFLNMPYAGYLRINTMANNYTSESDMAADVDDMMFRKMLPSISINDRHIAYMGFNNGKHWNKIVQEGPALLTGFGTSAIMLERLKERSPLANVSLLKHNTLLNIPTDSFDAVLSTLSPGRINDLESTLLNWCRIVNNDGDILITGLHCYVSDTKRAHLFKKNRRTALRKYVQQLAGIKAIMGLKDWEAINEQQILIDERLKHYYESLGAAHLYREFEGLSIAYGLHFKKRV